MTSQACSVTTTTGGNSQLIDDLIGLRVECDYDHTKTPDSSMHSGPIPGFTGPNGMPLRWGWIDAPKPIR